jgi:hypothetical protein
VELLSRQIEIMEAQGEAFKRLLGPLSTPGERRQEEGFPTVLPAPYDLLGGRRGLEVLARAFPGFAELWVTSIPPDYIAAASDIANREHRSVICCPCGVFAVPTPFIAEECAGQCGRWFLVLENSVRVHNFQMQNYRM